MVEQVVASLKAVAAAVDAVFLLMKKVPWACCRRAAMATAAA